MHSGARFCVSCAITVTFWAVWLLLGLTLAGLTYIAVSRELPVPDFVLRRIEGELAASGFELQFGRARLDPTGKILLEDVRLRNRQFEDPLLTCRLLYLRHDFWSLLSAQPSPVEIQLEGAALQLPAMLSASGTTEQIISGLSGRLHYEHHVWRVEQLACQVGRVRVTAAGELLPTTRTGVAQQFSLSDLVGRYLESARQVAPFLHSLEAFDDPSLQVRLSPGRADLLLTVSAAHKPWGRPVVTGPLAATAALQLQRPGPQPVTVLVSARRVEYPGQAVIGQLSAHLDAQVDTGKFTGRIVAVDAAAGSLSAAGEQLVGPRVRAELSDWPAVHGEVVTFLDGEFIGATADVQLAEKSARVRAEGRVAPGLISRVLTEHTPRAAAYFVFADPVWFQADAVLEPGWNFASVAAHVDAGRLDSHGVKVTAARGRIDIKGTDFLAHDAYAEIGENHATGSYWMDFASTDYRMLLEGRLRPVAISGWFRGDWWPEFWNRSFAFPGPPPTASVDVAGRWRDTSLSNNFVVAHAAPANVWGGDFDRVDATVFVRPGFAHAWAIDTARAGGAQRVSGSFKRIATPGVREGSRFEFDFAGNPELPLVARMLQGRANDVVAMLAVAEPPALHAWGAVDGTETHYQFTGHAEKPLHFLNFPFDRVSVAASVHGTSVLLEQVDFEQAGGTGRMRATLETDPKKLQLGFDLFVNDVTLSRIIHTYEEFNALRSGRPYVATPDNKFVRKAGSSQLDFSLSAHGVPGQLTSYTGSGSAALTGAELGEVHLFGLLSQVLSGLSLSFSSLKFDAVRTSFRVENGVATFPDLKVTGPSAVIDGHGTYSLATNALDFNARFKPYDQPGSLLAAAFGLVMNPLTSILDLRLTGGLADPKWSIDVFGSTSGAKPASAPATPPAKSSPAKTPATAPPPSG